MIKTKLIQIYVDDDIRLITLVKDIILKENPDLKGLIMDRKFLIKVVLDYVEETKNVFKRT